MEELVSTAHRDLTRYRVKEAVKAKAVDQFLKDPRFQRFQVFAHQGIRILDNTTHEYLYVNEATEHIIGWTAEDFKKGGLLWAHRRTHPWDLLQLVLIAKRVLRKFDGLTEEDKLNSRFSFDLRFRHKDGKYRRIQQHSYTISLADNGKPGLLMMVSADISALKTATSMNYQFGVTRGNRFQVLLEGRTKAFTNLLSERETELLHCAADGLNETAIAQRMHISVQTVKTHRKNMLAKTGCKNFADLIRKGVVEGWI